MRRRSNNDCSAFRPAPDPTYDQTMFDLPTAIPTVPYTHSRVTTDDGVDLAVQSVGTGPAVVLANGIGVTAPGLDFLVDHLRQHHRVITWDYRGIGRSVLPKPAPSQSIPRNALDALQVMAALGEPHAAVLGWSLGVPVGLEMIRTAPDRVRAFGALFGCPGRPFQTAFPAPVAAFIHGLVRLSAKVPAPAQALLDLGLSQPRLTRAVCNGVGFSGPATHHPAFMALVKTTASADRRAYFRLMAEMMDHDARDVLPSVRCPTVIVAGEHDRVTPPRTAQEMAARIVGSRLVIMRETTHFGPLEHGPALWQHIDPILGAPAPAS
jgi:pimeloyl-ACP methyl ester carboxylesterase